MEETFREILTRADGTQGKQTVALAVLKSLQRGAVIPRLTLMLLDIVREDGCLPPARNAALEAYIQQSCIQGNLGHQLKELLAAVYAGSVSDPSDDLLGLLLAHYIRKWYSRSK